MRKVADFIMRLIVLPFVLAIGSVVYIKNILKLTYWWLMYGGEIVLYQHKNSHKTVKDIYDILVDMKKTNSLSPQQESKPIVK